MIQTGCIVLSATINSKVSELLAKQIAEKRHIGVQVCAYQNGIKVVDTCEGKMGVNSPRPVQPDTLFLSFSTTKGVAATAIHMLADRGLLDYDSPVTRYWPEFGKKGKDKVTVAQALSHQAGIHALPSPFKIELFTDWNEGLRYVEEAKPGWEPGTATGYHAVTWGWIAGGLIEKISGKHVEDFVAEEIAKPLGLEDEMFIGLPDGVEDRLAETDASGMLGLISKLPPPSELSKAINPEQFRYMNEKFFLKAPIPSYSGFFTARALAKMYAALALDGSLEGIRLVSKERIKHMQRIMTRDVDRVLGVPVPKGIGYFMGMQIGRFHWELGPRQTAFGHSGMGGSVAFADPEAKLSIAVTLNKMQNEPAGTGRALEICDLIRNELDVA
jgi:CubicO group peptidase (beta-lactamase class C family)